MSQRWHEVKKLMDTLPLTVQCVTVARPPCISRMLRGNIFPGQVCCLGGEGWVLSASSHSSPWAKTHEGMRMAHLPEQEQTGQRQQAGGTKKESKRESKCVVRGWRLEIFSPVVFFFAWMPNILLCLTLNGLCRNKKSVVGGVTGLHYWFANMVCMHACMFVFNPTEISSMMKIRGCGSLISSSSSGKPMEWYVNTLPIPHMCFWPSSGSLPCAAKRMPLATRG